MHLHPYVVMLVKLLIEEGHAGPRPFGIPREIWEAEIRERDNRCLIESP